MSVSSLRSFNYLEQLPGTTFTKLYQQPSAALAVFRRFLPHLAKTIVMAMLFMPGPFPLADLESWFRPDSSRQREESLNVLDRLKILVQGHESGRNRTYRLTKPFGPSLQLALTGGGTHHSFGVPCETPAEHRTPVATLDRFAREKWEGLLYYIVGSAGTGMNMGADISTGSKKLLELGGYVEPRGRKAVITADGFTFLLQELNLQLWDLMIVYLDNSELLGMDSIEVLSFLFTLGSLEVGQDYSTTSLTATQKQMLEDLNDFGIIFWQPEDKTRFYPTRLAVALTSDNDSLKTSLTESSSSVSVAGSSNTGEKGFIVIETNYRLYAYTSSLLQIAILALFTKLSTRYPNMISGKLTKESIQHAINMGIKSQQIVSYLTAHAHPIMRSAAKGNNDYELPVLPPTVVDQIRLWQMESDRMLATAGFIFRDFVNRQEYEACAQYADTIGVLIWRSDEKRLFFVSRYEQLQTFLANRKDRERNGATS